VKKVLAIVVVILGVAVLAGGIASIIVGQTNAGYVTNNLKQEKVSMSVFDENAPADKIVSTAADARKAVDTLIQHRRKIAPTYADLLQGKKFDPTNTQQLTYAQAMNLQNSMTTSVLAFGLTTVLTLMGALLIVAALALILVGWIVLPRRKAETPAT
jgi:outer membrane murein-binding lipoprotein Lpp